VSAVVCMCARSLDSRGSQPDLADVVSLLPSQPASMAPTHVPEHCQRNAFLLADSVPKVQQLVIQRRFDRMYVDFTYRLYPHGH
jgi:hypothetical protein